MGKLALVFTLIFSLVLMATGCESGTSATLGESDESSTREETESSAPQEPVRPDLLEVDITGYPAETLQLIKTGEGEGTAVILRFVGLTKNKALDEKTSGTATYQSGSNTLSIALYTDDFEVNHELYEFGYTCDTWEQVFYAATKFEVGGDIALGASGVLPRVVPGDFEASYTEEQLESIASDLYKIIQKEMKKNGEPIS